MRISSIDSRSQVVLIVAVAAAAIVLSLFTHSPVSNENWGYWLFARIFAETGEFINPDRSPLYTVYLNAFRWMGYPASVAAEYLVTTSIVMVAFVGLFRRFMGLPLAVFTGILWIPFLQSAAPAVQPLALACSFWGMALRRSEDPDNAQANWTGAYALFLLASMFRFSSIIFVVLYGLWDIFRLLRRRGFWSNVSRFRPNAGMDHIRKLFGRGSENGSPPVSGRTLLKIGGPIAVVAVLLVWFNVMQSPSQWNNGNFETMTYYPVANPKSMSNVAFIQGFNLTYIKKEYGSSEIHDFYFTNQELFDGESSTVGAILASPGYVVEQIGRNFTEAPKWIAGFSVLRPAYLKLGLPKEQLFNYLVILAFAYGALRLTFRTPLFIFVIGNTAIVASSLAILPEFTRHFVPIIPILILSAIWYGSQFKRFLESRSSANDRLLLLAGASGFALISAMLVWKATSSGSVNSSALILAVAGYGLTSAFIGFGWYGNRDEPKNLVQTARGLLAWSALPVVLVLFSNSLILWPDHIRDVGRDVRDGTVHVLGEGTAAGSPGDSAAGSPGDSLAVIQPLVSDCRGLLTAEHKFFGAFMALPTSNIYDVSEIPPFGTLGDPEYLGLNPGRIDCVAVSDELATEIGHNVNVKLRYQNYVEPYVKQLQEAGAITHQIPDYGIVVVLPR